MTNSLDTSEAEAQPWVKPAQPVPGEEGAPTLTKEEMALGAFLAAMHDSNLDGGKMREAMLNVLGPTATQQAAPSQGAGDLADRLRRFDCFDRADSEGKKLMLEAAALLEASAQREQSAASKPEPLQLEDTHGLTVEAQPAREWVGLTDEDKLEILRANGESTVMRITESKLREKNTAQREQPAASKPEPINKYAEFWERLPGHLIDNHEGEELTEELLQRAAADLYAKFPDLVDSGLIPFGLLLLKERATTRQLIRALREATEPPIFMGEPVVSAKPEPQAQAGEPDELVALLRSVKFSTHENTALHIAINKAADVLQSHREAIAKKDAALMALVVAGESAKSALSEAIMIAPLTHVPPSAGAAIQELDAAISQGQEAME